MQEASLALDRVRALAQRELGARYTTVAPFFDEAGALLATLRSLVPTEAHPLAETPSPEATQKMLVAVLSDIEDLLALYLGIEP